MTSFTATDHLLMARALRLAERGAYTTRPNPMVGCVIARGDEIVGEGFHQRAGEAHAEVLALQAAAGRTHGATAYVTLEPCAHTGRTGPCVEELIGAGISRVVAGMRDPFPQVDGAGFEKLRAAGLTVDAGLMEAQARQINRGFLSRLERGRPWVRIKLGTSLDGRTAMASGESKWISGEASRVDVHKWRARAGALITGANTVLIDDPSLTVRLGDDTPFLPPLRVVLDPGLATIARGKVRDGSAPTLYLHAADAKPPRELQVERAVAPVSGGRFDLEAVLKLLAARDINEVQVEAGATLAGAFVAAGLADEILLYVAPVLLGERARPLFAGLGIDAMAQRAQLTLVDVRAMGEDQRILLRPASAPVA